MDYQQSQVLGQEIACAIENGIRNGVEAVLAAQAAERRTDRLVTLAGQAACGFLAGPERPSLTDIESESLSMAHRMLAAIEAAEAGRG